jgi:hypothetical protein
VPSEGSELLIADYDQIELRVIAHLADDPGLVEAFRSGLDIHNTTAARVYGVEPADVTLAMRSKAKMISYGLAYGMEAYGLSQRLGVGVEEAAESSRSTSRRFRMSSGTWNARSPKPGGVATPRRCSAGAATCPSSTRATSACARPLSAKR